MKKIIKRTIRITIWIAIIFALAIGGYSYWHYQQSHPATDDAYVRANVIYMAAQVSGPVQAIYTENHALVHKGDLLFTIDPQPFQIAVTKAKANLTNTRQQLQAAQDAVNTAKALVKERQAELVVTRKNTRRILTLVKQSLYPVAKGDETKSNLKVAEAALAAAKSQLEEALQKRGAPGEDNAQIKAAKAALATAKLNLQYTRITAPATGNIVNFTLRQGSMVTQQQQLFALVETNNWWVDANFKETDLERIKPGQPAIIKVDIYPDYSFKGTVTSISRGSGAAFALLPPEDATGNWVKVTQRFPVKIKITNLNPNYPLRVGASSKVTIDATSS